MQGYIVDAKAITMQQCAAEQWSLKVITCYSDYYFPFFMGNCKDYWNSCDHVNGWSLTTCLQILVLKFVEAPSPICDSDVTRIP